MVSFELGETTFPGWPNPVPAVTMIDDDGSRWILSPDMTGVVPGLRLDIRENDHPSGHWPHWFSDLHVLIEGLKDLEQAIQHKYFPTDQGFEPEEPLADADKIPW